MNRNLRRLMIRSMMGGESAPPCPAREEPLPETLLKQTVRTAVELAKSKAPASTVLSRKVNYLVEAAEASMAGAGGLFPSRRTPFYYGSWPLWLTARCFQWLWTRACKGRSCSTR